MYFKRDAYDPSVVSEAQTRLANFQGATAISSNQYFGRDEEQEQETRGGSGGGLISEPGSNIAAVETAARDLVGRVMANPDVQNVGESIRTGALKVRRPRWSLLRSADLLCSFPTISLRYPSHGDDNTWVEISFSPCFLSLLWAKIPNIPLDTITVIA